MKKREITLTEKLEEKLCKICSLENACLTLDLQDQAYHCPPFRVLLNLIRKGEVEIEKISIRNIRKNL